MVLLVHLLAAFALTLLCSTGASVFGLSVWGDQFTVQAGIIVAVYVSLHSRFGEAAWVMLFTAYLNDLLASGPPGLFGFSLTLVFFALYAVGVRVGGRRLVATLAMAFAGTYALTLLLGLLYGLFFPGVTLLLMGRASLLDAVATALCAVPYTIVVGWVEQLWRRRRERSIVFD